MHGLKLHGLDQVGVEPGFLRAVAVFILPMRYMEMKFGTRTRETMPMMATTVSISVIE